MVSCIDPMALQENGVVAFGYGILMVSHIATTGLHTTKVLGLYMAFRLVKKYDTIYLY